MPVILDIAGAGCWHVLDSCGCFNNITVMLMEAQLSKTCQQLVPAMSRSFKPRMPAIGSGGWGSLNPAAAGEDKAFNAPQGTGSRSSVQLTD